MENYERYKKTYPHKTDAQIIEALASELSQKVETIHSYLTSKSEIRVAVAKYMRSEGCSCCRNIEVHKENEKKLAELLDVEMYDDGSGYDFSKYSK